MMVNLFTNKYFNTYQTPITTTVAAAAAAAAAAAKSPLCHPKSPSLTVSQ